MANWWRRLAGGIETPGTRGSWKRRYAEGRGVEPSGGPWPREVALDEPPADTGDEGPWPRRLGGTGGRGNWKRRLFESASGLIGNTGGAGSIITPGDEVVVIPIPEPPAPVYITALRVKIAHDHSGGNRKIKPVVYKNDNTKVITGQELTITAAMAGTSQDLVLTVPALTDGVWYIGIQADGAITFVADLDGVSLTAADAYSDGVADTLGSTSNRNGRLAVAAVYQSNRPTVAALDISGSPSLVGTVDEVYTPFTPDVAGGVAPYTFGAINLPTGLAINTRAGRISGTTTEDGSFNVVLTVTDAEGTTDQMAFTIEVEADSVAPNFGANGAYSASSASSYNAVCPTGITNKQWLELSVHVHGAGADFAVTTPSGWTLLAQRRYAVSSGEYIAIFYKSADGTESGTNVAVAFTGTFAGWSIAGITRWYGVDRASPVEALTFAETPSIAAAGGINGSDITTLGAGRTVITKAVEPGGFSSTPGSGWTEYYDAQRQGTGLDVGAFGNYKKVEAEGAVAKDVIVPSSLQAVGGLSYTFALKGVAAGDDPYHYQTILIHNFQGADGSTTATDQSAQELGNLTFVANAQIDTAQFYAGASALLLDGTDDFVSMAGSSLWAFGTGDLTIEMRVRFTAKTGHRTLMSVHQNNPGSHGWFWEYDNDTGNLVFAYSTDGNSDTLISRTWNPSLDTWYDLALDRSSGTLRMYVNGVMLGASASLAGSIPNPSELLQIGASRDGAFAGTPYRFFNGHIGGVRITKPRARFASDGGYTPLVGLFPDN